MTVNFTIFYYPEQKNEISNCQLQETPPIQSRTPEGKEQVPCPLKAPSQIFTITEPQEGKSVCEMLTVVYVRNIAMQIAATSQDQIQKVMKDLLQEEHYPLQVVLKDCLPQVAAEMFSKKLISQSVKDDPTYDKIIDEFVAGMKSKNIHELQDHWKSFLQVLSKQCRPACDAANHLASELSDNKVFIIREGIRNVEIKEEDKVLEEVRRLQLQFASLMTRFKNQLSDKVKDKKTLEELTDYVLIVKSMAKEELSNIQDLNELFKKLHPYFDFLDCELIVAIAAAYISKELSAEIREHSKQAANFRRSQSIKELRDCLLQIYVPHLKNPEHAPIAHIKLNEPWNEVNIEGLYLLIKHFLPKHEKQSLINHIKISPGSVLIKYIVRESQVDQLIAYAQDKLQFMRLIGMFSLVINDTPILPDEDENENFTFDIALLEAAKEGHTEAVHFLIELGANVDTALLKAVQDDQIKAVSVLMELGGNVDDALLESAKHGRTKAVHFLIELGASVNTALLKAVQDEQIEAVSSLMELGGNIDDALLEVAKQGHSEAVCLLLKLGARINHKNIKGSTPLILATLGGHEQIVQSLVSAGADVNIQDNEGWTALMIASGNGHIQIIELLLIKNADVNIQSKSGVTALMLASQNGDTKIAELLIKETTNMNIQDINGWTALMIASHNGHTKIAELLLKANADVNIHEKSGFTALMLASRYGHTKIAELLLKAKADVNIQEVNGVTALMIASEYGHTKIAEQLLKENADINIQINNGWTALMIASFTGHTHVAEILLEADADVNIQDEDGMTALMLASEKGHTQVVELLLKKNADVNIQGKSRVTALMLASQNGHTKVVELLVEELVDIDVQKKCGSTALMLASIKGHVEVAECLLQSFADPHIIAYNGLTAFSLAAYNGNKDIVNMLLDKADPTTDEIEKAVVLSCYGGHTTLISFLSNKLPYLTNDQRELLDSCIKGDLGTVVWKTLGSPDTPLVLGLTPLMVASSCGHVDIVDPLIQAGANVNKQESHLGFTPLFFAVEPGQSSLIVETLLKCGASPNIIANTNETPLDVAMYISENSKMDDISKILIKYGGQTTLQLLGRNESELYLSLLTFDERKTTSTSSETTHKMTAIKPFKDKGDTINTMTNPGYGPIST